MHVKSDSFTLFLLEIFTRLAFRFASTILKLSETLTIDSLFEMYKDEWVVVEAWIDAFRTMVVDDDERSTAADD
jgi:hypothetical protein